MNQVLQRVAPCLYCPEQLHFVAGAGWLHPNGELYATVNGRDDHCACPDYHQQRLIAS